MRINLFSNVVCIIPEPDSDKSNRAERKLEAVQVSQMLIHTLLLIDVDNDICSELSKTESETTLAH